MFSFRTATVGLAALLLPLLTSITALPEPQPAPAAASGAAHLSTTISKSPLHSLTTRQTSTNASNPDFTNEELYNLTSNFWNNFLSPLNCEQSKQINSPLLAPDIQGRIDVTRNFVGSELNTEYLFGLFCNLQSSGANSSATAFNILGVPQSYKFTQFAARGNLAANTVLVDFYIESLDVHQPVAIQSFITFNAEGQIAAYDAIFKWFDWQFSSLFTEAAAALHTNSTASTQSAIASLLAQNICGVAQQYCTPEANLQQYSSNDECMNFLTTQIPFGQAWQLGMNVLACRDIHVNMVPFRPDVHCAHIGPSGGGYCTDDREYKSYVSDEFFSSDSGMLQTP